MAANLISSFSEVLSEMENKFPFIVKLGREAEACLNSDNVSCVMYLERMGRAIIRLIFKRYNLFTNLAENDIELTQENLQLLKDLEIINAKNFNKFKTLLLTRDDDNAKNLIQLVIPLCRQLCNIYESKFNFLNEKFPYTVINYLNEAESKLYSDNISFFVNLENACEEAVKFIIENQNIEIPIVTDIRERYDVSLRILRRDRIIKENTYNILMDVKKARNNFAHTGTGDFMLEDKEKISLLQRVKTLFKFFASLITLKTKTESTNNIQTTKELNTDSKSQDSNNKNEDIFDFYETASLDEIQKKLETIQDINEKSNTGTTILMHAAKKNNSDVINLLLSKGANINDVNKKGWTALFFAASNNTAEIVKLLLDNNADLHIKNKKNYSALSCALEYSSKENINDVVRTLLKYGADENTVSPNGRKAKDYLTDIQTQNQIPKTEIQNQEIKTQIHEKISDNDFIKLCVKSDIHEISDALKNGANINSITDDKSSALMWAAKFNNSEVVNFLINNGADVNLENSKGRIALDFASVNPKLKNTDALNKLKYKSNREFLKLCRHSSLEEIQIALDNGADVNSKGKDNSTALMFAARFNNEDVIKFLIEKGADINFKNINGRNALYFSKANENLKSNEIIKLLDPS